MPSTPTLPISSTAATQPLVLEAVTLHLNGRLLLRPAAARRERIDAALAECGLQGFARRDPATLSGGQRARVALMRTLLAAPSVLLLDEPFSQLDTRLRSDFRQWVFGHARRHGLPTLLVTHDRADAEAAGGHVIELQAPA